MNEAKLGEPIPTILVDARMVSARGHGIGRYVEDIARAYAAESQNDTLPFRLQFLWYVGNRKLGIWCELPTVDSKTAFLSPLEALRLQSEIKETGAAIYHTPSFSSLLSYPCPTIQTVHDLNHLHFGGVKEKIYYRTILRRSLRMVSQIATVSETSRAELSKWLGISTQEIALVPNAVIVSAGTKIDLDAKLTELGLEHKKFFFSFANGKTHKNLDFLLNAYSKYHSTVQEPYPLLLTMDRRDYLGLLPKGIVFLPEELQGEVYAILAKARCLCFPSLYEGFGRPPLEALQLGVPALISDIPVHRELVRSLPNLGFTLLPLDSADAWAEVLRECADITAPFWGENEISKFQSAFTLSAMWAVQRELYCKLVGEL